MNKIIKSIMIRSIRIQMEKGKTFEEAVLEYPRLTAEEITELRGAVEVEGGNA